MTYACDVSLAQQGCDGALIKTQGACFDNSLITFPKTSGRSRRTRAGMPRDFQLCIRWTWPGFCFQPRSSATLDGPPN